MSTHNALGSDTEEIMYADEFVIDEGGIDLKVDGICVLGVSFDNVDNYQLAYEVLPENYVIPEENPKYLENQDYIARATDDVSDVDLELLARTALTALARRNGYEKK